MAVRYSVRGGTADRDSDIYGVSTDRREEDWKKAIEEDKSYWNQVLLQKDDVKDVLESYCICLLYTSSCFWHKLYI